VRGGSEQAALREKGIIIIIFSPRVQRHWPQKAWIFWGALRPHKGEAAGKFEALSSASQIVNERLMKCVQPAQNNKVELKPFKQLFSNHHWSRIMQP
jgi:hypothetical protein